MIGYLERCGLALDELLNALTLNGDPEETVSLHAAKARAAGKRWGCALCWLLGVLVETAHCDKQLQPGATKWPAALRAGALILAVFGAMYGACWVVFAALF